MDKIIHHVTAAFFFNDRVKISVSHVMNVEVTMVIFCLGLGTKTTWLGLGLFTILQPLLFP